MENNDDGVEGRELEIALTVAFGAYEAKSELGVYIGQDNSPARTWFIQGRNSTARRGFVARMDGRNCNLVRER